MNPLIPIIFVAGILLFFLWKTIKTIVKIILLVAIIVVILRYGYSVYSRWQKTQTSSLQP